MGHKSREDTRPATLADLGGISLLLENEQPEEFFELVDEEADEDDQLELEMLNLTLMHQVLAKTMKKLEPQYQFPDAQTLQTLLTPCFNVLPETPVEDREDFLSFLQQVWADREVSSLDVVKQIAAARQEYGLAKEIVPEILRTLKPYRQHKYDNSDLDEVTSSDTTNTCSETSDGVIAASSEIAEI